MRPAFWTNCVATAYPRVGLTWDGIKPHGVVHEAGRFKSLLLTDLAEGCQADAGFRTPIGANAYRGGLYLSSTPKTACVSQYSAMLANHPPKPDPAPTKAYAADL